MKREFTALFAISWTLARAAQCRSVNVNELGMGAGKVIILALSAAAMFASLRLAPRLVCVHARPRQ